MSRQAHEVELGERTYTPFEIAEQFACVGRLAEDGFVSDVLGLTEYFSDQLPEAGFQGIFRLESGLRAKFYWITRPELQRRSNQLHEGSLTIRESIDGTEFSYIYNICRIVDGNVLNTKIDGIAYQNREAISIATDLLDDEKLRSIHETLSEIEGVLTDTGRNVEWYHIGQNPEW